MYHFIEDKTFLKRAQAFCSKTMKQLEFRLREDYGINSQYFLVGSGGRNLVTQNGDEPIDFDYNLNIISSEDWDEKYLKESVLDALNEILEEKGLDDASDSTSVITTDKVYFTDNPDIRFSIDICIVRKTNDGWERLIHQKTGIVQFDRYYWNLAPNSSKVAEKSAAIKSVPGWWLESLRPEYLRIKNNYLSRNEKRPSFVCYIEAVNNVYNTMRQRRIL